MSGEAPRTRHRSKSAPRGRSPAPKALKKASKAAGLVTPPPRPTRGGSGSSKEESSARRKISFKEAPKVTPIIAEYKAGGSNISEKEADEVFQAIKDSVQRACKELPKQLFHLAPNRAQKNITFTPCRTNRRQRKQPVSPKQRPSTGPTGKGLNVLANSPKLLDTV